jgi:hypothetical protein
LCPGPIWGLVRHHSYTAGTQSREREREKRAEGREETGERSKSIVWGLWKWRNSSQGRRASHLTGMGQENLEGCLEVELEGACARCEVATIAAVW